jgi:hypothetical protein
MNQSNRSHRSRTRRRGWIAAATVVIGLLGALFGTSPASAAPANRATFEEINRAWERQFGTPLGLREGNATGFVDPEGDATGGAPDMVSGATWIWDSVHPALNDNLTWSDGETVSDADVRVYALLFSTPLGELPDDAQRNVAVHLRGGGYPDPQVPPGSPYEGTSRVLGLLTQNQGGNFQATAQFFQVDAGESGTFPFSPFRVDFGVYAEPGSRLVIFVMPQDALDPAAESWRAEAFYRDATGEGNELAGNDADGTGVDAFVELFLGAALAVVDEPVEPVDEEPVVEEPVVDEEPVDEAPVVDDEPAGDPGEDADAARIVDGESDGGGFPWLLAILGFIILLAIAGLAVVRFRSRRPPHELLN